MDSHHSRESGKYPHNVGRNKIPFRRAKSSKTGQNIEQLFETMTGILFDRYPPGVMRLNRRLRNSIVNPRFQQNIPNSILKKLLEWITDKIKEILDSLSRCCHGLL
jgi:hypothetical protein